MKQESVENACGVDWYVSDFSEAKLIWIFNFYSVLKKYRIQFDDGSEDYVSLNDISRGTNMFLLPNM